MPSLSMFTYSPVAAFRPSPSGRFATFSATTPGSRPALKAICFSGAEIDEIDNVRTSQLIGGSPEIYNKETNTFEDARNNLIATAIMVRRSQVQIEDRTY